MKAFGFDLRRVAAAFIVTFCALAGGRTAAYHLQVERPVAAYLAGQPDVVEYRLARDASRLEVAVRLADVRDVQSAYERLEAGLAEAARGTEVRLALEDARTEELASVYRRIRLCIEEAISRGTFRDMAAAVDSEAERAGLDRWGVYVDSSRVYVQLHMGASYLYDVIPRDRGLGAAGETSVNPAKG